MNRTRFNRSLWVSAGIALAAMGAAFQGIDARFSELDGYLRSGLLAEVSRLHAALEADYGRQANSDNYLELVRRRPYIHLVQDDRPSAQVAFKFAAEVAAARRKPDLASKMLLELSAMIDPIAENRPELSKLHKQVLALMLDARDERLLPWVGKLILQAKAAGTLDDIDRDANRAALSPTIGWKAASTALTVNMAAAAFRGDAGDAGRSARSLRVFVDSKGDPLAANKAVADVVAEVINAVKPESGKSDLTAQAFYQLAKGWQDGPLLVDAFELAQWHDVRLSVKAADERKLDCLSALDSIKKPEFKPRILATAAWLTGRAMPDSAFKDELLNRLTPLLKESGFEASNDPFTAGRGYQANAEWMMAAKPTNFGQVAAFNLGRAAENLGKTKRAKDIKSLKETFLRLPPKVRQIGYLLRPLRSVRDQLESSSDPDAITEWYGFWLDVADQLDFQSAVTLFEEALISLRATGGTSLPVGERPRTAAVFKARKSIAALLARAARTANKNGQTAYVSRYFQDLVDLRISDDSPRDFLEAAKQVFLSGQIFSRDFPNEVVSAASQGGTASDRGWAQLLVLDYHLNKVAEVGARKENAVAGAEAARLDDTKKALQASKFAKEYFTEAKDKDGLAFEQMVWADHKLRGFWVSGDNVGDAAYKIEFVDPSGPEATKALNDFSLEAVEKHLFAARSAAASIDARVAVECRLAVINLIDGRPEEAESNLTPLLKELSAVTDRRQWLAVAELVGRAQHEQKKYADASKTLRDVIGVVEGLRSDAQSLESVKRQVQERFRDSYFRAIDAELQLGHKEEAFLLLQMTKSRTLLDGIFDRPTRFNALEDGEVDLSGEIRSRLSEKTLDFLVAQNSNSDARSLDQRSASYLANDLQTLEKRLEGWEALMNARNPGMARQASAPIMSSKEAAEFLNPEQALLEFGDMTLTGTQYLPGRREEFLTKSSRESFRTPVIFLVEKDKELVVIDLPAQAGFLDIKDAVISWAKSMSKDPRIAISTEKVTADQTIEKQVVIPQAELDAKTNLVMSTGFSLTKAIIDPLKPHLQGIKSLLVSPQGVFWKLPVHVLPLDAKGDKVVWEDYAVEFVPSISVLSQLKTRQESRATAEYKGTVLALTNPYFGRRERVDFDGDGKALSFDKNRLFKALRGTQREGDEIRSRVSSGERVVDDKEATEEAFRSLSPSYRVIHLATHAIFLPGAPLQSLLALADANPAGDRKLSSRNDGLLTGREVQELDFNAQLVVLSACETGKVAAEGSEDTLGLLWSFFISGANMQVLSSWEVDDKAASTLMGTFYSKLYPTNPANGARPAPLTPAEALRQASLMVRSEGRSGGNLAWRHPYFWGAFYSVGHDIRLPN